MLHIKKQVNSLKQTNTEDLYETPIDFVPIDFLVDYLTAAWFLQRFLELFYLSFQLCRFAFCFCFGVYGFCFGVYGVFGVYGTMLSCLISEDSAYLYCHILFHCLNGIPFIFLPNLFCKTEKIFDFSYITFVCDKIM